jgi:hypothetical protein
MNFILIFIVSLIGTNICFSADHNSTTNFLQGWRIPFHYTTERLILCPFDSQTDFKEDQYKEKFIWGNETPKEALERFNKALPKMIEGDKKQKEILLKEDEVSKLFIGNYIALDKSILEPICLIENDICSWKKNYIEHFITVSESFRCRGYAAETLKCFIDNIISPKIGNTFYTINYNNVLQKSEFPLKGLAADINDANEKSIKLHKCLGFQQISNCSYLLPLNNQLKIIEID